MPRMVTGMERTQRTQQGYSDLEGTQGVFGLVRSLFCTFYMDVKII